MKQTHVQTAIKALKRQRDKYQIDRDRFEVAEESARKSKEFFEIEVEKLKKQIASLEEITQKELQLTGA